MVIRDETRSRNEMHDPSISIVKEKLPPSARTLMKHETQSTEKSFFSFYFPF